MGDSNSSRYHSYGHHKEEMMMRKWLETYLEEKGISTDTLIEVNGQSGLNIMTLEVLLTAIYTASKQEQAKIKTTIIHIDIANGKVIPFFQHLAQAIAQ